VPEPNRARPTCRPCDFGAAEEWCISLPYFEAAFVDGEQRLWLAAPSWPAFQSAPRRWSVFSPEGVWLGDLEAPERVWIVDSLGDVVLGIGMDELDVPYVQFHRLIG